jgi:hypothetical protein
MTIQQRLRWYLVYLRRRVQPVTIENFAVYTAILAALVGLILVVGAPAKRAWADITHVLSAVARR